MAGVPWQPDLADVFEADLATADNLTDPVDTTPEERTVDTVQALLMGRDLLNEPESERVLNVKQQTNENIRQNEHQNAVSILKNLSSVPHSKLKISSTIKKKQ